MLAAQTRVGLPLMPNMSHLTSTATNLTAGLLAYAKCKVLVLVSLGDKLVACVHKL